MPRTDLATHAQSITTMGLETWTFGYDQQVTMQSGFSFYLLVHLYLAWRRILEMRHE
jgi:hypothetical protein